MGSKTITCPVCSKPGYLIKEKPRPKKRSRHSREYNSTIRKPNPIFEVVHNIKNASRWKPERCYLGVYQKVIDNMKNYRPVDAPEWDTSTQDTFINLGKKYKLLDPNSGLPTEVRIKQGLADVLYACSSPNHKHSFRAEL